MALLRSDLVTIFEAIINGNLRRDMVDTVPISTVVKYAAPFGYPDKPVRGQVWLPLRSSSATNFKLCVLIQEARLLCAYKCSTFQCACVLFTCKLR